METISQSQIELLTESILKFALDGTQQMGVVASAVTARPVFGRIQSAVARVEYLQNFRPFFSLVERTQHRQAGPFPTARPATTQTVVRSHEIKPIECKYVNLTRW